MSFTSMFICVLPLNAGPHIKTHKSIGTLYSTSTCIAAGPDKKAIPAKRTAKLTSKLHYNIKQTKKI